MKTTNSIKDIFNVRLTQIHISYNNFLDCTKIFVTLYYSDGHSYRTDFSDESIRRNVIECLEHHQNSIKVVSCHNFYNEYYNKD